MSLGQIVLEAGHLFGYGHERLLHGVLRFGIAQAGFAGQAVNQLAIGVEEIPPTLLVIPVLQAAQETPASRDKFVGSVTHVQAVRTRLSSAMFLSYGQILRLI